MLARFEEQEDITDSVGLLISILVRYPEVAVINYNPQRQMFCFNFICSRVVNEQEFKDFEKYLMECIASYNFLEGQKTNLVEITHQVFDDLTLLEIKRDVNSLAREEISLVVKIVCHYWQGSLIADFNDIFMEEDLIMQEQIIEYMLESVKESVEGKHLYAFREEGKVMVFNK